MPVNWSAYEDIADFFTNDVKEIDGVRIYGHMDYGKRAPDLGWRMTDAWLSMAGSTSPASRTAARSTNGASAWRKGPAIRRARRCRAAAGPTPGVGLRHRQVGRMAAQVCASGRRRPRLLPVAAGAGQGNVAQQIFWYTAFVPDMVKPKADGNNTVDDQGNVLWRMAPSPHGPYWKEGMKLGYQDAGSWTLFNSTPVDRRKAAWLYAQFVVSKTVDVKKSQVGLTIIRDSTISHKSFTERAPKLGGLVEFYRSPDRVNWTPTGINVPDYPKLAQLWWQQIGDVNSGAFTPQEAMDRLAGEMDDIMARMQAADEANNTYGGCGPRLNPEKSIPPSGSASRTVLPPSSRMRRRRARPSPMKS